MAAESVGARTIDLAADVGEGFDDTGLLAQLSSAHVACGLHAGDPSVMERTVAACAAAGVAVGAHPGYPDREGFGRRPMALSPAEIRDLVLYQIGALRGFCIRHDVRLAHVKAHGALWTRAARERAAADAIVAAVDEHGGHLVVVGPAGSALEAAATAGRIPFAAEAFADRRYLGSGELAPREHPDAVIDDPAAAAAQAVRLVTEGRVATVDGAVVAVRCQVLSLHGDATGAAAKARAVRAALLGAGVEVAALGGWL